MTRKDRFGFMTSAREVVTLLVPSCDGSKG